MICMISGFKWQYAARLHADKLKRYIHKLNGKLGIKNFNMRLAASEVSDALTGYSHNAVSASNSHFSSQPCSFFLKERVLDQSGNLGTLGAGCTSLTTFRTQVTPVCMKTRLPIFMSDRIPQLNPDYFWLGAGEVDLKVGMSAHQFVNAYKPCVIDCTYNDEVPVENTSCLSKD